MVIMINKSQAHQAKKGDLGKWKFYLFWGAVCHVASTTDSMYKNRNLKEMKNVWSLFINIEWRKGTERKRWKYSEWQWLGARMKPWTRCKHVLCQGPHLPSRALALRTSSSLSSLSGGITKMQPSVRFFRECCFQSCNTLSSADFPLRLVVSSR